MLQQILGVLMVVVFFAGCGSTTKPVESAKDDARETKMVAGAAAESANGDTAQNKVAPAPSGTQNETAEQQEYLPTDDDRKIAEETKAVGKSLSTWIAQLDSPNSEELQQAINMLALYPDKARAALPRLKELSRHSDSEVAAEAQQAIRKIQPR